MDVYDHTGSTRETAYVKILFGESHGFWGEKEGSKFRLSFRGSFLTVLEMNEKESRNFNPSITLVQNISVEPTQTSL